MMKKSLKRQRRTSTNAPLHVATTAARSSTAVDELSRRREGSMTPAKRDQLWDSGGSPETFVLATESVTAERKTALVSAMEHAVAQRSRQRLEAAYVKARLDSGDALSSSAPLLAFERWQLETASVVPQKTAPCLTHDLERAGAKEQASAIARECARGNAEDLEESSRAAAAYTGTAKVVVEHCKHSVDVRLQLSKKLPCLGLIGKKLLKVQHAHFEKLRALHARHGGGVLFEEALYSLLLRYSGAAGHGFHAALPSAVFIALRDDFGVTAECFASPLNCFFGRYCSASVETDADFGSVGNFFDVTSLKSGSYELNPPFVPEVMRQCVERCESMLEKQQQNPLSMCLILPGWKESEAWRLVNASKWKRGSILVSKDDHGYVDGAQHQRRDRHRASPYDTLVAFLQNDAGAQRCVARKPCSSSKRWPCTKRNFLSLRAAFATGVPTTQEASRRLKRGRGTAPEDGAGAVYKGKNKNRTTTTAPHPADHGDQKKKQKKQKKKQRSSNQSSEKKETIYGGQRVVNF